MKYLYSVATGPIIYPFESKERSEEIFDIFVKDCDGFTAIHLIIPSGILWLYDSLNNAKAAKNIARMQGICCGKNIARFIWDEKDNLEVDIEWMKEQR